MADEIKWEVKQDNRLLVLAAMKDQVQKGLAGIGLAAASHAKKGCPVDTGRLRNSISYATATKQGAQNNMSKEKAKADDYKMRGIPEGNAVYIGTNVEYAASVEYLEREHKNGGPHFIKNAATGHGDEYKKIMEAALKS